MIGLVLEGGGAKGAFQIGAYKALKELGIKIDGVTGTSIGALNGALIAQGDEEKAYEIWSQVNPSKLFQLNEKEYKKLLKLDISISDIAYFFGKMKDIVKNKGLDVSLIKSLLHELVDETKMRNSKMEYGLVTFSLTNMKPYELFLSEIPPGKVIEYLMASASFPVFKLEKVDGNLFIDGGVFDNMPINLLIRKGYKEIIAIRTFGIGMYKKITDPSVHITYINPSEDLGGVLDFDNTRANKNLQLGYYDTLQIYKKWQGKFYYIEPKKNDDHILRFLMDYPEDRILELGLVFGFKDIQPKRMMFEFILPRIADLLGFSKEASYEDIIIGVCEEIAKEVNVERFHLYSFESFIQAIAKNNKSYKRSAKRIIPGFIKQNEILSRAVKEEIFHEIISKILSPASGEILS